MKLTSNKR